MCECFCIDFIEFWGNSVTKITWLLSVSSLGASLWVYFVVKKCLIANVCVLPVQSVQTNFFVLPQSSTMSFDDLYHTQASKNNALRCSMGF